MQRYLLKIEFDGTAYHGWQVQPNGMTVQCAMQNSLEHLFSCRPALCGCSRTDAGVHAREFFCHFDLEQSIPCSGIVAGLNSVLPADIRVYSAITVEADFHCRYRAKAKNYVYEIDTFPVQSPFRANYALHYPRKLEVDKIRMFCTQIVGTHDFCSFSSAKRTVYDTVRTVSDCDFTLVDGVGYFTVTADGFLYNMVRILVGTALAVSEGRISQTDVEKALLTSNRSLAGKTVSPQGLYLNKVFY